MVLVPNGEKKRRKKGSTVNAIILYSIGEELYPMHIYLKWNASHL